ncbi:MAG: single-stranded DNA-binding protein [Nitrospinales bacterium]
MPSFNKVLLMGNLTRDPELRFIASGTAVASFGMAINRKYKQGDDWKEDVCFVDITVWGKQAENCAEYLNKGRAVFIEGYLRLNSWQTETGEKRNKLEVVANTVQFLNRPGAGGGGGGRHDADASREKPKDDVPF